MRPDFSQFLCKLFLFGIIAFPAAAQQPCPAPPVTSPAPGTNIFSPQQEVDLGDVIAEQVQREFRVIDDEEVTGYLQHVGERLLKHLPETNLKFRFYLFDVPVLNAWGLPGGRIYVSRKTVALLRSEDELAGLLGHEMGHLVARQPAVDMTMAFREVLGVTRLGDRRDIFDQYNRMVENIARKPKAFHHSESKKQREQLVADQVGVAAAAASGYSPQSFVDLFDRMAQTKGKTGNWLSDLFGATNPESKRLRELMHNVSAMPAGCIETRRPAPPDEFRQWRSAVIAYSGLGHEEQLHAVLQKRSLDPPLRGELSRLQFSPDGKYFLAQDESNLYVLTRDPLEIKFRVDAPDAFPARFTPDSREVAFYTPSLRVERWNVAEESRTGINELVIPGGCLQTLLSPDARVLACLGREWDLSLYDVAAGSLLFQKKDFYTISFSDYLDLLIAKILDQEPAIVRMGFTPDARYFAAGAGNEKSLILDVASKREVTLPASARKLLFYRFAFLAPDRLIGVDQAKPENSAIVNFPSGEIVERVPLGGGTLEATQNARFMVVRPVKNFPVGLIDLQQKTFIMASKARAMDVAGEICINERRNGEVGLYRLGALKAALALSLPRGSLGPLRAQAVSRDLRWLAISQRRRGVWDLEKGQLAFSVAGFRGAYFADDGIAYAEFPKSEQSQRRIARMHLKARFLEDGVPVVEHDDARQYGSVLLRTTRKDKNKNIVVNSRNVVLDALDVRTGATLWSRAFPKEAPDVWSDPDGSRFVLAWPATSDGVKNEIRNDASLLPRLAAAKYTDRDVFVEVLDAHSGKTLGALLVPTGKGSFQILHGLSSGDWVIFSDNLNRLLVYSLSTGEEKGKFFGRHPAVSPGRDLLAAGNEQGQLVVYDLATMTKREEFVFASPLAFTAFDGEGKRLFVLTESQTAYVLDVSSAGRASR